MFPGRYFPGSYWAARYWVKTGIVVAWTSLGGLYRHREALFEGTEPTLEVCMRQTTGTAWARLYDVTADAEVEGSVVSTTEGDFVLVESEALALTDGHLYRAQFGAYAGEAGEMYSASLIMQG